MKDWYFYQDKGRTMGPLSLADLKARVRDGRLRLFDLIYKEGEPGWRMALEHPDLRGEFQQAGGNTPERPWVCLHRKGEESFEFMTLGPYSLDEVREAIAAGHLSYDDYGWRQEFAEWKRLGSLEEFNPRAASLKRAARAQSPPEEDEETPESLLRNVVEARRIKAPTAPVAPSGARGPDLTKSPDDVATRVISRAELERLEAPPPPPSEKKGAPKAKVFRGMTFKPPEAARDDEATRLVSHTDPEATRLVGREPGGAPDAEEEFEPTIIERRPLMEDEPLPEQPLETASNWRRAQRRFSPDWAIVIGLVVVLMGVIVLLSRRGQRAPEVPPPVGMLETLDGTGTPELRPPAENGTPGPDVLPAPATPAPVAPPVATVPAPTPAPTPPPPPPPKPKAPTLLTLTASSTGEEWKIDLRSNGSPEYPVYLQVVGLPGQVADGAAYYRYVKIPTTGDTRTALDIPDLGLAPGRYHVRAESAGLQRSADLNIAVGETSYKQAVARARKVHAAALWTERLALYRQARALEQRLAAGRIGERDFEALARVQKSNGATYTFFEDWWEMKEIAREARQQAITPALKERARRLRERVATFSVWRLR